MFKKFYLKDVKKTVVVSLIRFLNKKKATDKQTAD